jgi:retron-type reverse transcriptase
VEPPAWLLRARPGHQARAHSHHHGARHAEGPPGASISPVLSNIYLDRLDTYIERRLLPCYNRGKKRAADSTYQKVTYALGKARKSEDRELARALVKRRRLLPAGDPNDPHFRRLTYVRYADDVRRITEC